MCRENHGELCNTDDMLLAAAHPWAFRAIALSTFGSGLLLGASLFLAGRAAERRLEPRPRAGIAMVLKAPALQSCEKVLLAASCMLE